SGALQCIATGTPAGLQRTLEQAAPLARHFEVVNVGQPDEENAIRIVTALLPQYEKYHGVVFEDGIAETAVYASGRFLPHRFLPDRALDLIDEAAARVKLRCEAEPPEIMEARRRIRELERKAAAAIAKHDFAGAKRLSEEQSQEQ